MQTFLPLDCWIDALDFSAADGKTENPASMKFMAYGSLWPGLLASVDSPSALGERPLNDSNARSAAGIRRCDLHGGQRRSGLALKGSKRGLELLLQVPQVRHVGVDLGHLCRELLLNLCPAERALRHLWDDGIDFRQ